MYPTKRSVNELFSFIDLEKSERRLGSRFEPKTADADWSIEL